jgi:hypothetical protein
MTTGAGRLEDSCVGATINPRMGVEKLAMLVLPKSTSAISALPSALVRTDNGVGFRSVGECGPSAAAGGVGSLGVASLGLVQPARSNAQHKMPVANVLIAFLSAEFSLYAALF